jgi:hypothetical protein
MLTILMKRWQNRKQAELDLTMQLRLAAQAADVAVFRETLGKCSAELRRARRYKRALSMIAIGLDPGDDGALSRREGEDRQIPVHTLFFLLGSLLRNLVRETDVITYSPERQLYVMVVPEASEEEALNAFHRINEVIQRRQPMKVRAGIAEFPRHGLTLDRLFEVAQQNLTGQVHVGPISIMKEASGV